MEPLNSLDHIAELIRRRASNAAPSKLEKSYTEKLSKAKKKHAIEKSKTAESVKHRIVESIHSIREQEPENSQKIISVFVENVLLWQFEDELVNDPNFSYLVDEVSAELLQQPLVLEQLKKI